MLTQLSKRDQMLLGVLGLILLTFAAYWLYTKPTLAKIELQSVELQALQAQKAEYQDRVANYDKDAQDLALLDTELQTIQSQMKISDKNYDFHYMFLEMANKSKVKIDSLDIAKPVLVLSTTVTDGKDTTTEVKTQVGDIALYSQLATMQIKSSFVNIFAFVDQINDSVQNLSVKEFGTSDLRDNRDLTFKIVVDINLVLKVTE